MSAAVLSKRKKQKKMKFLLISMVSAMTGLFIFIEKYPLQVVIGFVFYVIFLAIRGIMIFCMDKEEILEDIRKVSNGS